MHRYALAAAALVAAASAGEFNWNSTCVEDQPKVVVYNKCSYDVHLWSVQRGQDCPIGDGALLKAGSGMYQENFRTDTVVGVSLKMSKTTNCKGPGGDNSAQLEYFINAEGQYAANYLDMSYVDCHGCDCPTLNEGYHMQAGNQNGLYTTAGEDGSICPVQSCHDAESCKKISYWDPNDPQTKSCNIKADLILTMCSQDGVTSSGGDDGSYKESSAAPSPSSAPKTSAAYTPAPAPSSAAPVYSPVVPSHKDEVAAAAAVTSAAAAAPAQPNVKTEVVYVTAVEYTYAKRHAHGHRHQHFHA